MRRNLTLLAISLFMLSVLSTQLSAEQDQTDTVTPRAYLPLLIKPEAPFSCATTSSQVYTGGAVSQADNDDPVRPAYNHADKNIALRGYTPNTEGDLQKELVDYGSDDPTQPPQFATLFSPYQVPAFAEFHQMYDWNWAASPEPGTRSENINSFYDVTALAFSLTEGEGLHVPISGYDIGGGVEVVVLYADAGTVTLHYSREDTAATGYTLHVDQICTDPNLLALYNTLDDENGDRYVYPQTETYLLPELAEGQQFGTTGTENMVIAISDTGTFQDPRSCNEWWQERTGYTGSCPTQNR